MVFLVDVAVEHRDVGMGHEQIDRRFTVARGPVPLGIKIEQRAMGQDHDPGVLGLLFQIRRQPRELRVAEACRGIGYVIQRDEVHALVMESCPRQLCLAA